MTNILLNLPFQEFVFVDILRKIFSASIASFLIFLICGALAHTTLAGPNYFVRSWHSENGLPQNGVTSVLQTHDGYIWVGTYSGLARFDGVRFTTFDNNNTPEMRSSRITSLFENTEGSLWIGHERGEITCYREGRFLTNNVKPGGLGRKIDGISCDEAGDVWLTDSKGIMLRSKDGLQITPATGSGKGLVNVANDSKGHIWVARNGKVSALHAGSSQPLDLGGELNASVVQGICAGVDGGLWITVNGVVGTWDGKNLINTRPVPWKLNVLTAFMEMRSGALIGGTQDDGLFIVPPDGDPVHLARANGLPNDWVESLAEDKERNLWVGTSGGLALLRDSCVSTVNPPDLWQSRAILGIKPDADRSLWVATEGAGVYRLRNGLWEHFGREEGVGNPYVWSISQDSQGRTWLGTWGGGLFMQQGNHFELAAGIDFGVNMPVLLSDDAGGLYIGTGTGLLQYAAGKTCWISKQEELGIADVRAVARDTNGAIWFGTLGGGLGCFENGRVKKFRKRDGLSSDFIQVLHFDENGDLWIGTFAGGLNRLKNGRFAIINQTQGLQDNTICDIEDDKKGFFWISSHGGIMRVSKSELNRCADGLSKDLYCQSYGVSDGMPTIECSGGFQPAGAQTPDGHLWFPTSKGLVKVDPLGARTNEIVPPVVIERLLVDDRIVFEARPPAVPLKISAGRHRFEFQYTGLSFVNPDKVHFKYRLDGLETEWRDAGQKRISYYDNIPPGRYEFKVIACNNDGIWNKTGAILRLSVTPYVWQTWWFKVLMGGLTLAAGGGVMWYDTRRRMRLKIDRVERQRALENERSRIAHDIHDDLGSTLTRITMLSESVKGGSRDPQEAETDFKQIYDSASDLTRAMDEIVWAVNPKHDTLESLVNYLQKFAEDFLNAVGIKCIVNVPMLVPAWPVTAEARHNLFLAFKEALNNVAKHASATEVKISLFLTRKAFTLVVADNGRGLGSKEEPTENKSSGNFSSGNGLENMKRRLTKIGGSCEMGSGDQNLGTKISFTVTL